MTKQERMRIHTVNYRERDSSPRDGTLVSRGFWWHGLPRLMPLCRLFGHKPVVDGTKGHRAGDLGSRWVCCDRCGVRPDSQGSLDPEVWRIGQRYDGPHADAPPDYAALRKLKLGDKIPTGPKPRNSWSHDQPKWWSGSFPYDLRDVLFGPLKYSYENVGDPMPAVVRMPYGDDDVHDVVLQLQRMRRGRTRGKPKEAGWIVDWRSEKGIPVRVHDWKGNEILGSSVRVSDRDVESDAWPHVAVTKIAEHMMRNRVHYGFGPNQFEDLEPAMDLG